MQISLLESLKSHLSRHKIKVSKLNIEGPDSHKMQAGMDWKLSFLIAVLQKASDHRFKKKKKNIEYVSSNLHYWYGTYFFIRWVSLLLNKDQ